FFTHDGAVNAVAYHADGKRIITAAADKTARAWTSALLWQRSHGSSVPQAIFSGNGAQVISAGDKTVKIWNNADGKELKWIDAHEGAVTGVGISADGLKLVSAGEEKSVKVWSLAPPKPGTKDDGKPIATFTLAAAAQYVALSPNGLRVAVSSEKPAGSVRVFDVASARELQEIAEHTGAIRSLAFHNDNRTLVTA